MSSKANAALGFGMLLGRLLFQLLSDGGDDALARILDTIQRVLTTYVSAIAGTALMIIMAWAGWTWMTAGPNQAQREKAKSIMMNGGIGAAILLGASILGGIVLGFIKDALGVQDGGGGGGGGGGWMPVFPPWVG